MSLFASGDHAIQQAENREIKLFLYVSQMNICNCEKSTFDFVFKGK